jgi:tetratricopeptide (TPR) repeat protein
MKQGTKLLENAQKAMIKNQRRVHYAISKYILGEVNSQIATGPKPSVSIIAKNIVFLIKNVPFAAQKAEKHFNEAIELFKEIGMKGFLGQVYLSLGQLYKATKRNDQARQCILEAINLFQECEAGTYLKQANEALESLV